MSNIKLEKYYSTLSYHLILEHMRCVSSFKKQHPKEEIDTDIFASLLNVFWTLCAAKEDKLIGNLRKEIENNENNFRLNVTDKIFIDIVIALYEKNYKNCKKLIGYIEEPHRKHKAIELVYDTLQKMGRYNTSVNLFIELHQHFFKGLLEDDDYFRYFSVLNNFSSIVYMPELLEW